MSSILRTELRSSLARLAQNYMFTGSCRCLPFPVQCSVQKSLFCNAKDHLPIIHECQDIDSPHLCKGFPAKGWQCHIMWSVNFNTFNWCLGWTPSTCITRLWAHRVSCKQSSLNVPTELDILRLESHRVMPMHMPCFHAGLQVLRPSYVGQDQEPSQKVAFIACCSHNIQDKINSR